MDKLRPVNPKSAEGRKRINEFQKSLGDTIILLLEIKNRNGITQSDKVEIDHIVEKLQEIIREIPDAVSRNQFQTVFGLIKKAIGFWRKLFDD